jgi:ubiquinone biosynthesis protein COQ4
MTAQTPRSLPSFAARPRRPRPQWRRAWLGLRRLLREPDRTENAFEVLAALDPDLMQRGLERMLSHPEGRRIFRERPCLLDRLADREGLARLPEASLGRAYLAHVERWGLEPEKLVGLGRRYGDELHGDDPDLRWYGDRSELTHDLLHVLTGYGADGLGETALLWFSHGLVGGRANALLGIGAALRTWREAPRGWLRYLWRARRRGRRAGLLVALPFEDLLPSPLADVRRLAGIEAPERAHPEGVRVAVVV